MRVANAVAGVLLFAGANMAGAQEHPRTIEIPLAMSAANAVDLIQTVALRGGWGVASTNEHMVTLDTYKPKGAEALNVQLRAN